MGSSLLSRINRMGGVSTLRKSNSWSSWVMQYLTSVASFLASKLVF